MLQKRIDDQPTISRENVREAEGIYLEHLRRVGLKQTEQRNAILRTFLETREHLSIDELHRLVKKTDPRIGFTTVYRTLKLLADCGLASEVAFHDGIARYEHQYNRRSHHHMVWTEGGYWTGGERARECRFARDRPCTNHKTTRRSHTHVVCPEGGASVNFFWEQGGAMGREMGQNPRCFPPRHTFQVYGVCEDCRDR